MPLLVSSVCSREDISQRLLESRDSILSRSRAGLVCIPQISLKLPEVRVEFIQLCLNPLVNFIQC